MGCQIVPIPGHKLGDVALAVRAYYKLNEQYPGYDWRVELNDEKLGGVLVVRNLSVSTTHGFVLKLTRVYADPGLRCVMLAGGEILERAWMRRGRWDGQGVERIDGIPAKYQPFAGVVV